jgi:RNA polymerase sigma-70 factor, ECF subfamily
MSLAAETISYPIYSRGPAGIDTGTPESAAGAGWLRAQLVVLLPALRGRAQRLERHAALADDLVQDTVEKALRSWHLFAGGSNLRGWLLTIMHNLFVDRCRARNRTPGPPDGEPDSELSPFDREPPPAWQSLTVDEAREMSSGLQGCLREAVELVFFQGLSYQEAGLRLGIPAVTVGTRLVRARGRLRELLRQRS